jgi:hypothetical protein
VVWATDSVVIDATISKGCATMWAVLFEDAKIPLPVTKND